MICKSCSTDKNEDEFYPVDKTCKECRKEKVRANRANRIEYYRAYDRSRSHKPERLALRGLTESSLLFSVIPNGHPAKSLMTSSKAWIMRNKVKRKAHNIVSSAVSSGKLEKEPCEMCGIEQNIHAHHDDYAKPLVVRWLCSLHHRKWHSEYGEAANG